MVRGGPRARARLTVQHLSPAPLGVAAAVAMSEELLRGADTSGRATVVWWQVSATALVVGRAATPSIVDEAACRRAGVPIVRRHTGGGPLLWDQGLVAVDVILPKTHPLAIPDVVEAYRWLGTAVSEALNDLGIPAERLEPAVARGQAGSPDDPVGRLCFGGLSPHEVVVGRRKIGGLCQARRTSGSLLQLGVLFDVDRGLADLVDRAGMSTFEFADAFGDRVATVSQSAPAVELDDLRRALKQQIDLALAP